MVYAGLRDARQYIPDPPPAQSAPDPHDEENMDARLIRRGWGKPTKNSTSCWRGKRRRASRTWPPYCHTCPRLHKGLLAPALHVCGRGYGGQFSPSSGQRADLYVHPVGVAPVPTRSGPKVTIPGYPGLSQFIWQYPCSTPDFESYPVFRWTSRESRDLPPPQGSQARRRMKRMA